MSTAEFIDTWHRHVVERNIAGVTEMLADDIEFHSPAFFKPYNVKGPIAFLLSQIVELLPDFHYVSTFSNDERGIVLHFEGTLSSDGRDYKVEGVDILTLDEHDKITKFVVMIRPLSSLQALAVEMKKRMAGAG
jgi:hypothetical protein